MKLRTLKPLLADRAQAPKLSSAGVRIRGSSLQKIRERILSRDCGVCQCARCKKLELLRPASIVDHIRPLWAGGHESDQNRQAINAECHDLKSAHEAMCRASGVWEPWTGVDP